MNNMHIVTFPASNAIVGVDLWRIAAVLRVRRPEPPGKPPELPPEPTVTALLVDNGGQNGLRVFPVDEPVADAFMRVMQATKESTGREPTWIRCTDPEAEAAYFNASYVTAIIPANTGTAVFLAGALTPFGISDRPPAVVDEWVEALGARQTGPMDGSLVVAGPGTTLPSLPDFLGPRR